MWNPNNKASFLACLDGIEQDAIVQQLKTIQHHTPTTTRYDHSLLVAYLSFLFCRKWQMDYHAAARAGMLHDLFHEDWDGSALRSLDRLRAHPIEALQNAQRYNLNRVECDIIVKHMWPITPERPRYREAYVVTMADKVASVLEKTHLAAALGIQRNLHAFGALDAAPV